MVSRRRGGVFASLSSFSAYPRLDEMYLTRTNAGGAVSVVCLLMMLVLFVSEVSDFVEPVQRQHMSVDSDKRESISFFFNISFYNVPCHMLQLGALDASGALSTETTERTYKMRLNEHGTPIAAPVSSSDLVQTMDLLFGESAALKVVVQDNASAKKEMEWNEGCTMWGDLKVLYAAGSVGFNFDPNIILQMPDLYFHDAQHFLMRHKIHAFNLGASYPGKDNPLEGISKTSLEPLTFQYFLKLVPTRFFSRFGYARDCFQYSMYELQTNLHRDDFNAQTQIILPGLKFTYDIAPVMAIIQDKSKSFVHFIVRLCAIIGGAYAIMGFIDKCLYNMQSKKDA